MELFKLFGTISVKNEDAVKKIKETAKHAGDLATSIGSSMKNAGDKISGLGRALVPVSTAAAGALGYATKRALDFQNGMAKMSTLFDTSKTSVSELSKQFMDLSNKTGISSSELAEAGYQALSAGQSVDKVGKFVETSARLAKAGFTSTTTAVDVLTTAMNAYGKKAGSANDIANKLVRTQNLGKTTVDELASSMGKIIPTAASMNVGIDNLTSGYVSLTKQGIATAEATTYMNSMMNELGDSGTEVGKLLKSKTGKSFQDLMKDGKSLADVLKIMQDHCQKSGKNFNELWGSAEAGKAALSILNGGVDEFNGTVKEMGSKTDDVGQALKKLETPAEKAKKAVNQLKNTGIDLATSLINEMSPVIDDISKKIEKLRKWVEGLDNGTKLMIGKCTALVAVAAPVIMIVGKVVGTVGSLTSGVGSLIKKLGEAEGGAGLFSKVIGGLTSPVGIAIGAIALLIFAFVALYNTNDEFKQKVDTAWAAIKNRIQEVVDTLIQLFEAFAELGKSIWDAFGEDIKNVITSAFKFIADFIKNALDIITSILEIATGIMQGDWDKVWDGIKNLVKSVWEMIKNIIKNGIEVIKSVIKLGLDIIKGIFKTIWDGITTLIRNVFDSIKNTIKNGLDAAKNIINNILNSIKDKFKSIFDSAKDIVKGAIDKIKSFFNFSWSLPKIKLPHISIKGSFSLMPPKVPTFGIQWYKKAMDDPYMFTKPTLFDVNPLAGTAKGAGEAGDEMIYGKARLMEDIKEAVASELEDTMNGMSKTLVAILSLLAEYFPELASMQLVTDTGALVGELAPKMNDELGTIYKKKRRGV